MRMSARPLSYSSSLNQNTPVQSNNHSHLIHDHCFRSESGHMVARYDRGFVSLNRIKSSRNTLTEHTIKIVLRRWQARTCAEADILVLTGFNALQLLERVDAQKQEFQC